MSDFLKLVQTRYSVRNYKPDAVPREMLEQLLEAGRLAPSAVNFQPWKFIVIREMEMLKKIQGCYHREWFNTAPVVVVVCSDHQTSWKRSSDGKDHADIDAAIAIDHITLQATALGLGTCWVCNFDVVKCSEVLSLPLGVEPVALLPIGFPTDENHALPKDKKRKQPFDVICWDRYTE